MLGLLLGPAVPPCSAILTCIEIPILSVVSLSLSGCRGEPRELESQRPNTLVLSADDPSWDQLGCADDPLVPELATPDLARLAGQDVFFRNAFVTTPI